MSSQPSPRIYDSSTTQPYGLLSLPASLLLTPPTNPSPSPVPISSLSLPTTPLAHRIQTYAKHHLPPQTYNHSLRVYSYGLAIARECFPAWHVEVGGTLEETWFCCAMLHDIGTPEGVLEKTRLSYEFYAGITAYHLLQDSGFIGLDSPDRVVEGEGEGEGKRESRNPKAEASKEQAESVVEAIFRHQDIQDLGYTTLLTRLIHLGTLWDNIGANAELVHPDTIKNVNAEYDRTGWTGCFRETVEREKWHKPYTMVARVEGFERLISGNEVTGTEEG